MSKLSLILLWGAFHGYSSTMVVHNEVIKYTNDVVTEGSTAGLFCRAISRIGKCTWTRMKDGMEFSSENGYESHNNVIIENSVGIFDDECWLTIPNVDVRNAGNWTCYVQWCNGGGPFAQACNNDTQQLQMKVVEEGGFGAIAAQHVYKAEADESALVAVRTNEKFDKCEIKKDDILMVEVDGDATKYECVDLPSFGKICAGVAHGCILKVKNMTAFHEGTWTFTIQKGNNWPEIVDVKLIMV